MENVFIYILHTKRHLTAILTRSQTKRDTPRPAGCDPGPVFPRETAGTVGVNETWTSADGREREPESRGGAAVPPDGAEADVVRPDRADAAGEDRTHSSKTGSPHRFVPALHQTRGPSRALVVPHYHHHHRRRRSIVRLFPRRSPEKKTACGSIDRRVSGLRPRFKAPRRRRGRMLAG